MSSGTPNLVERINVLRAQISQDESARFQHSLNVMDADRHISGGDQAVDDAVANTARASTSQLALIDLRLSTRKPMLVEYEKELAEIQAAKKAAAAAATAAAAAAAATTG